MFGAFVLKESYKNWKEMRWGHEKLKGDWKLAVKKKKKTFSEGLKEEEEGNFADTFCVCVCVGVAAELEKEMQ